MENIAKESTQEVKSNTPQNLEELRLYLEGMEKEIKETEYILAMSAKDVIATAEGMNSARKLKKLLNNVLMKNININRSTSSYALEALSITKSTIELIDSKRSKFLNDQKNDDTDTVYLDMND